MAYVSKWRFARITARKARLLTDLIRNKPVEEALDLLKFNKKRGAIMVAKVLKSAIANADAKEADTETLFVSKSFCDEALSHCSTATRMLLLISPNSSL